MGKLNGDHLDPTAIDISPDPLELRMCGTTAHGWIPFDVPYMTEIAPNLWQGGCTTGLVLPKTIKHVVSLYPWERYKVHANLSSELYITMYDSTGQETDQVDNIAEWVNQCRKTGPVLVHCQAGLNRSSLVSARAMYLAGDMDTGRDIVTHLREVRSPAVLCNPSFEDEVLSWR
ncbi:MULTISPECIES: dual specificity protein phosphatase family protein [Mycobacteroides]|jgi:protein-tyrosine phosphatase|uniref:dual specificity protein phosphatase family protein n=1 Tax=Mycobacteroides TaxID=670516 RepID=UPI0009279A0F|nr:MULTISPECIES: dual specificity protein phosphatase family protein [Mycobacteroides]MBV6360492.1 dual specificity protein phosphatase family protein [Mycobacteroides chelonae]SHW94676.1 Predicted protein tyrosine phosphatase [Mycobacteroides abscessus subsp. abscessus]SKM54340.1 Predicted protein tyrosine phosphatase [Mycobacteroides abscessus subsp. abscessus]SLK35236.1 Predicted protein tyrosine phosphatase [Mycobacteroides abscessus subsp. abscessus]